MFVIFNILRQCSGYFCIELLTQSFALHDAFQLTSTAAATADESSRYLLTDPACQSFGNTIELSMSLDVTCFSC